MRFGLSISASTATKVGRISPLPRAPANVPSPRPTEAVQPGRRNWSSCPICVIRPVVRPSQVCGNRAFRRFPPELFRPRAANAVMSEQIEECGVSVSSWRDRHRAKFLHPRNTGQPANARSFARVPVHSRRYAQLLASVGLRGGVWRVRPGVGHIFSHQRSKARRAPYEDRTGGGAAKMLRKTGRLRHCQHIHVRHQHLEEWPFVVHRLQQCDTVVWLCRTPGPTTYERSRNRQSSENQATGVAAEWTPVPVRVNAKDAATAKSPSLCRVPPACVSKRCILSYRSARYAASPREEI